MHIVGPYLTTTAYKKRKEKITKAKQADLEQGWRERNVRLKEMGLPKETFEQYTEWVHGRGKKEKAKTQDRPSSSATVTTPHQKSATMENSGPSTILQDPKAIPSLGEWITGACSTKQTPTYTGTKIIGIAQTHKSNAIPVFDSDHIEEISRMRR